MTGFVLGVVTGGAAMLGLIAVLIVGAWCVLRRAVLRALGTDPAHRLF